MEDGQDLKFELKFELLNFFLSLVVSCSFCVHIVPIGGKLFSCAFVVTFFRAFL